MIVFIFALPQSPVPHWACRLLVYTLLRFLGHSINETFDPCSDTLGRALSWQRL